jgi:hypothetical protein
MALRWAPGDYDQLHHFISSGVWNEAPLEEELAIQADKLIGGASAVLVIDDTALPKKGSHSVGGAPQYASALGKTANCQTLVSLTLTRDEVPVMIGSSRAGPQSFQPGTSSRHPRNLQTETLGCAGRMAHSHGLILTGNSCAPNAYRSASVPILSDKACRGADLQVGGDAWRSKRQTVRRAKCRPSGHALAKEQRDEGRQTR